MAEESSAPFPEIGIDIGMERDSLRLYYRTAMRKLTSNSSGILVITHIRNLKKPHHICVTIVEPVPLSGIPLNSLSASTLTQALQSSTTMPLLSHRVSSGCLRQRFGLTCFCGAGRGPFGTKAKTQRDRCLCGYSNSQGDGRRWSLYRAAPRTPVLGGWFASPSPHLVLVLGAPHLISCYVGTWVGFRSPSSPLVHVQAGTPKMKMRVNIRC